MLNRHHIPSEYLQFLCVPLLTFALSTFLLSVEMQQTLCEQEYNQQDSQTPAPENPAFLTSLL